MLTGEFVFSQLMSFLPKYDFQQCVKRYRGNYRISNFFCRDQSTLPMPAAQANRTVTFNLFSLTTALASPRLWAWAGAALLFAAVFLAYFPSLDGGFLWDDHLLITDCKLIKASDGLCRFWFTTEPYDYWSVPMTKVDEVGLHYTAFERSSPCHPRTYVRRIAQNRKFCGQSL